MLHFIEKSIMKKITIYTTQACPYCRAAKELLRQKNVNFDEIDVSENIPLRAKMTERAKGHSTVPQIFLSDEHIGGCDELYALDQQGKLDALLTVK